MTDTATVHRFANGIRARRDRLLQLQIDRYSAPGASNLHEPEEEAWFRHVFAHTGPDGCFLDVGAAIGYYATLVRLAKPGWSIHAMEPLDEMRQAIEETFALNGLAPDRLVLDARALSSGTGSARLSTRPFASSLVAANRDVPDPVIAVETIGLAELLDQIEASVTLMKMDIQGHEREVLTAAGAALATGKVRWIILGTHGARIHADCLRLLQTSFDIVHQDQTPPEQPDGLIVGRFAGDD